MDNSVRSHRRDIEALAQVLGIDRKYAGKLGKSRLLSMLAFRKLGRPSRVREKFPPIPPKPVKIESQSRSK